MLSLVLASTSPRRKDILKSLGINFYEIPPSFNESLVMDIEKDPVKLSAILALKKAESVVLDKPNLSALVLGADTLVFSETSIFGKPASLFDAKQMLEQHSGRMHKVVSSICCINTVTKKISKRSSISKIYFKKLSVKEIGSYLKTDEWRDAAGGYKIQGKASFFIKKIEGSYSAIVGLPVFELYSVLEEQKALYLLKNFAI